METITFDLFFCLNPSIFYQLISIRVIQVNGTHIIHVKLNGLSLNSTFSPSYTDRSILDIFPETFTSTLFMP